MTNLAMLSVSIAVRARCALARQQRNLCGFPCARCRCGEQVERSQGQALSRRVKRELFHPAHSSMGGEAGGYSLWAARIWRMVGLGPLPFV